MCTLYSGGPRHSHETSGTRTKDY